MAFAAKTTIQAAVIVTPDVGGNFSITTPGSNLTTWALANGAVTDDTQGTWGTYEDSLQWPSAGVHQTVSGATLPDQNASLTIPFSTAGTFNTATLYIGSTVQSYGSNWGQCMVYVNVGATETLIFRQDSPDQVTPVYFNYNGTTPAAGWYGGSTDISSLVAGASDFSVRFYSARGWADNAYNGAVFYDSYGLATNPQPDFKLEGTAVVPEPASLAMLALGAAALLRRRRA